MYFPAAYFRTLAVCAQFFFASCSNYNGTSMGILTPNCVRHYHRIYVTRAVPHRYYRYVHEDVNGTVGEDNYSDEDQVSFRIVGGSAVSIENVPYAVLYGLYCGGTIIAPEWIITAAHCKDKEKFVIAGSTSRSSGTRYKICAHYIHPLYKILHTTHDYDYQLVLLESPIPVTTRSQPIAIGRLEDVHAGVMVTVSGWGHLRQKEQMQDNVRIVIVPVLDSTLCKSLPNTAYHTITSRMFCAGFLKGAKDSCQGDSGGPAVADNKLLGLVSYGVGCAEPDQPGVYTNIPAARDWIRYVTALPL